MMANILISLLGDQTVPIVLLIQDERFSHIDDYVFVTTQEMEQKSRLGQILAATLLEEGRYQSIKVPPEYPSMLIQVLEEELTLDPEDHYYVNLTGGTKMMSVGLYQFFIQHSSSITAEMFYKPIGKNAFIRVYPEHQQEEVPLTYHITIQQYLVCYGIQIVDQKEEQEWTPPTALTERLLQDYIKRKFSNKLRDELNKLRKDYDRKKQKAAYDFEIGPALKEYLQEIAYPIPSNGKLSKPEIFYFTGGWLEAYLLQSLQQKLGFSESYLRKNINIQRRNLDGDKVKNEFDIVFVKDNTLHIIEAKTALSYSHIDLTIFKLQALRQEMGLRVKAYLFTPSILGKYSKKAEERANLYNIKIFDQKDFLNDFVDFHP